MHPRSRFREDGGEFLESWHGKLNMLGLIAQEAAHPYIY